MTVFQSELEEQRAIALSTLREARNLRSNNYLLNVEAVGTEQFKHPKTDVEVTALKVYYEGVYGYIPKILMDDYDYKSLLSFINTNLDVFIEEIIRDDDEVYFIANRKDALAYQSKHFYDTVKKGYEYDAFIAGVDRMAVWLNIHGVRVKMSKEEYSYRFIKDMRTEVFVGNTIRVRVTAVENDESSESGKRISVSRRVFEADPKTFLKDYTIGQTYGATIESIDYNRGVFVSVGPKDRKVVALAGFPSKRAEQFLKEGNSVSFKVRAVDMDKGFINGILIFPELGQINKAMGHKNGRR